MNILLCPEMMSLNSTPSIVIHNDTMTGQGLILSHPSGEAFQFLFVFSHSTLQLQQRSPTLCLTSAHQASLSFTVSWSSLKLTCIESMMPSNHLILCHPSSPPALNFPSIWVFSNESVLRIRWPKYWSFSFSISPSNEQSGLISFKMDWLDLLAVQGTLKSLL